MVWFGVVVCGVVCDVWCSVVSGVVCVICDVVWCGVGVCDYQNMWYHDYCRLLLRKYHD